MDEHPSKDIIGSYGDYLRGKRIVLCITASVAAYKAVDLARLFMRYGAEVYPVISREAIKLITPDLLHWATGNKAITKLTKELEHIQLADYNRSDLIVIYPCTGNTISKIVNGIDDTSITSIATVALGSKIPLLIAPAMHEAMYNNPILLANIERLKNYATIVEPDITENKAKVARREEKVLDIAIRILSKHKLMGKKILITAGSTAEYIDPIRIVSSKASGKFGVEIARTAYRLGADVKLIYGHGSAILPDLDIVRVDTSKDMYNAVINNVKDYDILIMSAAVTDYKPFKSSRKIETRDNPNITIELTATEKIIDKIKKVNPTIFLVAFKALYNVSKEELINASRKKMKECNADLIFANDVSKEGSEMGSDNIEGLIIDDGIKELKLQSKSRAAKFLLDYIAFKIGS